MADYPRDVRFEGKSGSLSYQVRNKASFVRHPWNNLSAECIVHHRDVAI
jgi:hypothetical protein